MREGFAHEGAPREEERKEEEEFVNLTSKISQLKQEITEPLVGLDLMLRVADKAEIEREAFLSLSDEERERYKKQLVEKIIQRLLGEEVNVDEDYARLGRVEWALESWVMRRIGRELRGFWLEFIQPGRVDFSRPALSSDGVLQFQSLSYQIRTDGGMYVKKRIRSPEGEIHEPPIEEIPLHEVNQKLQKAVEYWEMLKNKDDKELEQIVEEDSRGIEED
jgi:hypothetical protein